MRQGIYYFKNDLRMVETAWLNSKKTIITVWTFQDMKSGRGFLTDIPYHSLKKNFSYLGQV